MKKPFTYLLTAGLAVSMITNTGTTYAESIYPSEATVTFTAPTGPVAPVDPKNPNNPNDDYNPEVPGEDGNHGMDGNVTGDTGLLTLDYVSNLNFEPATITETTRPLESTTIQPFIQVTDLRGEGTGWNIRAQAGNFRKGEKNTLIGSTIDFKEGTAASSNEELSKPDVFDFQLTTGGAAADVASAAAKTTEDVTSGQGIGTWAIGWLATETAEKNSKVVLTVPSFEASEGTHTAIIEWTLSDGPGI